MPSIQRHEEPKGRDSRRAVPGRQHLWLAALALTLTLTQGAWAAPAVSGDGACGIRAVDNESFVTCDGDRAPPPAGGEAGRQGEPVEEMNAVMLSCRRLAEPARPAGESMPAGTLLLQCRPAVADRIASARP